MEVPRLQLDLQAVFWVTAAVAYVLAVCSQMARGNLAGVAAALFAHSMVWFAIWFYRLRHSPEAWEALP
ncbi:MAG TPA: hypothetical protein VNH11_22815 [Pirellulales bacterium]|nr:hypothetical protein [Pirellulales bacterium]